MAPSYSVINARDADGPLVVQVSAAHFPQTLAAVLWRYDSNKRPDGMVGEFRPQIPTVPLGTVSSAKDKYYLLEGAVISQGDDPPTPYQVVVTISQGDRILSQEVPQKGGSGQIGTEDVPFRYRFVVREAL